MEEPISSPRAKQVEGVASSPRRRQRASTSPARPAPSPKRSPRAKASKAAKTLSNADIPPPLTPADDGEHDVRLPSPLRLRSLSEPEELLGDSPREESSRLSTFLSTPFVQCIRNMMGAGRNSLDDDENEEMQSQERDTDNGMARSPGLQRSRSRFHLSVTSPKPQPNIRELVRGKSKKPTRKSEKKTPASAKKKSASTKGTDTVEFANAKPTSKSTTRKKSPAPTAGLTAGKRKLPDSAQSSKSSKQPKLDTAPAKKLSESKKPTDSGKVSPSKHSSPRRHTLAANGMKKPSTPAEQPLSDCSAAIASTAPVESGNTNAADLGKDVESKRPTRSPSRPKRGRSASPETDKSAKKKNQAANGVSTTVEQSTSTKKRRHSLPSSIRVDQPATSSTSRKNTKASLPPVPDDPVEAFALYMERADSPSEVLPGLWLGGFNAWYRGNDLLNSECREVDNVPCDMFFRHHDISNVVSLGSWRPECADFPGILEDVAHLDIDDCSVGDDLPAETLCDDFERLVTKMVDWRLSDKKMYVHCRAGQSRSATIVVAYYAVIFNFPVHEALAHLYQMRPGPVGVLPGQQFLKALKKWENSDLCQKARERFRNEPGRLVRVKRDIQFLAEAWQKDLGETEDYVNGMFADLVRNVLPEFAYEPKKHLLALTNLALSLSD
eukprot:GEMP01008244.1.p1 GENE.GEMP01008244.1~~GEMP01008244.1.p1  ORF type:complete len:667 (+),score=155.85 GEMP01008244.1:47-2047(+)